MPEVSYRKSTSLCAVATLVLPLFLMTFPHQSANAQEDSVDDDSYLISSAHVKQDDRPPRTYEVGVPIEVTYRLHNPKLDVPAEVPLHITLYDPDGNMVDNVTLYSEEDEGNPDAPVMIVYSFTPQMLGDYTIVAEGTYEELASQDYRFNIRIRPGPEYTFEVDGKTATVTVDSPARLDFVRSVELDAEEKMLSIMFDKMDYWTRLRVDVPYALLGDPYAVRIDGEIIDVTEDKTAGPWGDGPNIAVVDKRADYARINLPIKEGVSHVEIIGTTALPEFPYQVLIVVTALIGTIIAISRTGLLARFFGSVR